MQLDSTRTLARFAETFSHGVRALGVLTLVLASLSACGAPPEDRAAEEPSPAETRRARIELAKEQTERGEFQLAREQAEAVLADCGDLPPEHADVLEAKEIVGVSKRELGDLQGARALFDEVLEARSGYLKPTDDRLLRTREHLALTLYRLGDYPKAREILEELLLVRGASLPGDHPDMLSTKQNLAGARFALGDLAGAAALDEEVLAVRSRELPADHPDLLRAKMNLGTTKAELGELAAARALFEEALAGFRLTLPPDHPRVLRVQMNLGGVTAELGDNERASELLEDVVRAWTKSLPADNPELLTAQLNLAAIRNLLGDSESARDLLEKVESQRASVLPPDHPDLVLTRQNLAAVRDTLGDFTGGRELAEQVLEVWSSTLAPDHPDLLKAMAQVANSRFRAGDLAGAQALQEQVVATREQVLPPEHPDILQARQNLASMLSARGDLKGALEIEEELLAAREVALPEDHPDLAVARMNLAVTRMNLGDPRGALDLAELVLRGRERTLPADHPAVLDSRLILAEIHGQLGEHGASRELIAAALTGLRARARALRTDAPRTAREGVRAELERLGLALALAAKSDPHGTLAALGVEALETLRDVSIAGPEITLALAGRADLDELRHEIAATRSRLNDLAAIGPAEGVGVDGWRSELVELASLRDRQERELLSRLHAVGVPAEAIDAAAIASALAPGAVAVSFLRSPRRPTANPQGGEPLPGKDELVAFLVQPDGRVAQVDLGLAREIEDLVVDWRAALGEPLAGRGVVAGAGKEMEKAPERSIEALGGSLRARLLDPILERAPGTRILHVVPDDPASLVPLDALPLEPGLLGDRIAVRTEVSLARLVRPPRPSAAAEELVVVGAIDYDADPEAEEREDPRIEAPTPGVSRTLLRSAPGVGSFPSLPATAAEARTIAELFEGREGGKVELLLGSAASRIALHRAAPKARYLHLATHGWFAPELFRSQLDVEPDEIRRGVLTRAEETRRGFAPEVLCGVALAGANRGRDATGRMPGILTAEELATWDLRACDLAVLSACETNVGIRRAGQGIQSLQAALHSAGARTAITSLWKVDDEATRRLMQVFYEKLWSEGLGKSEALWAAKSALRAEGRPPREWAAWVLTGATE